MRSASAHSKRSVRAAKRVRSGASRDWASTRLPFRTVPGKRSAHQAIDGAPQVTTSASVVARSHHGASMPPAIHEQAPSPSARPRSTTSTASPRSASSRAQARPATPAPTTMTEDLANR